MMQNIPIQLPALDEKASRQLPSLDEKASSLIDPPRKPNEPSCASTKVKLIFHRNVGSSIVE